MNELKCYKLEFMPAGNAAGTVAPQPQAQMPFGAPQQQGGGDADDLPF